MVDAARHYDVLLAEHYTWMLGGDVEVTAAQDRELLEGLGITAGSRAIDLGCGPGPQTLALADIGFAEVIGVDTSQELLDELTARAGSRAAVRVVNADIVGVLPAVTDGGAVDLAVCMRDTVVHMPSRGAVVELFAQVARALVPGGRFVLTYRDLSLALAGTDRFVPVRSDEDRIMLCALDYADPDTVTVTDLIYTRGDRGWDLRKSSYPKLRLAPEWLREQLGSAGLEVTHHALGDGGMWATVAAKPAG